MVVFLVLISGAGNTTVVFLSTPSSTRVCKLLSWRASEWATMMSEAASSGAAASCSPSALTTLALLPLGLGLPGHRTLHAVRKLDVLELQERDGDAPDQRLQMLDGLGPDRLIRVGLSGVVAEDEPLRPGAVVPVPVAVTAGGPTRQLEALSGPAVTDGDNRAAGPSEITSQQSRESLTN